MLRDGVLQIQAQPWALVFVDGERKDHTPLRLTLKAGSHTVRLEHPEFEPYEERVTVPANDVYRMAVDLNAQGKRRRP